HTRFDCDWSSDVCSSDLLLQEDAHHRAMRLVADEELILEGAELACTLVAVDAGGGLTHLPIREKDTSRHELRNALGLGHHSAARSEERRVGKSVDSGGCR